MPWTGAGERRTLFFKYSPFPLSWAAGYYNPDDYPGVTEAQRLIVLGRQDLLMPYAGGGKYDLRK